MNIRPVLAACLSVPMLATIACQTTESAGLKEMPGPASLAGTRWRLVEFRSMDNAQGTTRITDPSRYALQFGADGRAAIGLDCNRGTGSWSAPDPAATGGSLSFGPIASTRAFCPQPSFGDALARHLGYVRSYTIRDGLLTMSLMADGGILVWEPDNAVSPN